MSAHALDQSNLPREETLRGRYVACIGGGYWGKNLIRNFSEIGTLGWICDTDPERRKLLGEDYPEVQLVSAPLSVLENPDVKAVAIATPAETHGALVRQALEAGKDVLVEKPLCLSVKEGKELHQLALQKGSVLMVGHLLWYHPAILKLKQLVDSGELGRIRYIYSNRLNLGKIRREENILWSFAPHDISVILGLLGEKPDEVQARGGNYLHDKIADVTVSLLSFPSGVRAHIFVSWLHPFKEQKLVVVGDRKMAVFNDVEPENKLLLYPHTIEWKGQVPVASKADAEVVRLEWQEPLKAECTHFLHCVQTRQKPRTDGEEAIQVLDVLRRCQEALDGKDKPAPVTPPSNRDKEYFVHSSAFVDENVAIGEGTTIWHVSHILKDSRIGKNCRIGQNVVLGPRVIIGDGVKIQNNVSVYEGVTLEDGVFCGPSMVFTNVFNPRSEVPRMNELRPTLVRKGATLGANCTIVCGLTIGQYAFVGAGAVVTRDVPDHGLVMGNPARLRGWMCVCGHRIRFGDSEVGSCCACGIRYQKIDGVVRQIEENGST